MKKILSNNYFVSLVSKIITTLIAVLNSIMINRYLGPTLKGEYTVIINYTTQTHNSVGKFSGSNSSKYI